MQRLFAAGQTSGYSGFAVFFQNTGIVAGFGFPQTNRKDFAFIALGVEMSLCLRDCSMIQHLTGQGTE